MISDEQVVPSRVGGGLLGSAVYTHEFIAFVPKPRELFKELNNVKASAATDRMRSDTFLRLSLPSTDFILHAKVSVFPVGFAGIR